MAALNNPRGIRVISRGFDLLKDKEKREGERITIEAVSKETGLAKMTVRKFLSQRREDVSGSPVAAAAVLADYLGVGVGDLLEVGKVSEARELAGAVS